MTGDTVSCNNPAIDGNMIVWSDNREGMYATYLYDASTGIEKQISASTSFSSQIPDISGSLVVYQDDSNPFSPRVYLYDIGTGQTVPVTDDLAGQSSPAVSGNLIVWQDYRDDPLNFRIYINGTTSGNAIAVSPSASHQQFPDIAGNLVVWQDNRNGNNDIYLYDLASLQETQITSDLSEQTYPVISGNRIVWTDNRNGINNEIFVSGVGPGLEFSLSPDGQSADHKSPSAFGSRVVWQQGLTGIYLNDTSLFSGALIALDALPGSNPTVPKLSLDPVFGDRIVWQETSSGNSIYLYTSGVSGACPIANFSHDFIGGVAPATVQFTDASTPGSTHWFWDFGDGSNSTLQNPVHTYTQNLPHDVILIVGNPYCRNRTLQTNAVVIGKPVADFTASPTTDIVPSVVSFSDASSGSPVAWSWDFGDGSVSNLRNPTHTYSLAGTYSVNLSATNAFGTSFRNRPDYIMVLNGANRLANTSIPGLNITNCTGIQSAVIDTAVLASALVPNGSVLELQPPADRGFRNITLYAFDGIGFVQAGPMIRGNITGVHLESEDIRPTGFSLRTGQQVTVNYSIDQRSYACNGTLKTKVWEGAVPADAALFENIALGSNFAHYFGTAYSAGITPMNFTPVQTTKLRMCVNASWVNGNPEGRNKIFIERIAQDKTVGEVLTTRFISHDPVNNLDLFEAEWGSGLSTFGLSSLSGSGNPFQLITLTIASHASIQSGTSGSTDDGGAPYSGSSRTGQGQGGQVPPGNKAVPPGQKSPPSAGLQTIQSLTPDKEGIVGQRIDIPTPDNRGILTIGKNVVAKDNTGNPLSSVTITTLSSEVLPSEIPGTVVSFAGIAYDLQPDGATFFPGVELSFSAPPPQPGQQYTIHVYDRATATWREVPCTYNVQTGKVETTLTHFCYVALFSRTVIAGNHTVPAPGAEQKAPATDQNTPTTAMSIFVSMMVFAVNVIQQYLLAAVGICGVVILLYVRGRKRRMDRIRYKL